MATALSARYSAGLSVCMNTLHSLKPAEIETNCVDYREHRKILNVAGAGSYINGDQGRVFFLI